MIANDLHWKTLSSWQPHGVMLTVDEDNLEFTDLSFDAKDDAHGDMMDTLEDYYRH